MSQQELEALARRLEIEARKHTGDLNADLHKAAQHDKPDYARNFIADFILGKPLGGIPQQQDLFATEG